MIKTRIPKYSVIIPVYNAEKTLRRCIESVILSENNDKVEIIIIDDGSTDNSSIICKEYAEQYPQIKYYLKKNGGVSSARNAGIKHAKGEWLLFLDSDDCYLENWLNIIESQQIKTDADFYQFSWLKNDRGKEIKRICSDNIGDDFDKSLPMIVRELKSKRLNVPYAKVFRRQLIEKHNIMFREELSTGEDLVFVFSYLLHAEHIASYSIPVYCAFIDNTDSLSRKTRDDLLDQLLRIDDINKSTLNKSDISSYSKDVLADILTWSYYRKAYTACNELHKYNYSLRERWQKELAICKKFDKRRANNCTLKTKAIALPVIMNWVAIMDLAVIIRKKL